MANTNIDLVGLDFTSLKNNLKSFLKNNTQFKDINYEGSNISVLLDVLAYNTYLNTFYMNMVASEMFLDSAQLRDSVVSHAKVLNYTPRSFVSSKSEISLKVTPNTSVTSVFVPKYTSFTSRVGANNFTFVTNEAIVLTANGASFENKIDLYEGAIKIESFVMNYSNTTQRFILSNPTIDVSSLEIEVFEDGGQTSLIYLKGTQLFDLTSSSKVFFVQASQNEQYELIFGDNVFGRRPKNGSTIVAKYRACSGELPNGAKVFVNDGSIDGHSNVSITILKSASGGSIAENLESIRQNAPRFFQSQNRAVTTLDYEVLLKSQFSDIQAISVFGGEEAEPPQFGKVFLSIDVKDADGAPEIRKQAFLDFLKDKTPLSIQTVVVDPEFFYVEVKSNVFFNVKVTTKTNKDIETAVKSAISSFNTNNLSNFKKTLYYSNFVKAIDNADTSIVSNDTEITLIKRISPPTNISFPFEVKLNNKLKRDISKKLSVTDTLFGSTLTSSLFNHLGVSCILVDDSLGNVFIAQQKENALNILTNVGTINYDKGVLIINESFKINSFEGNFLNLKFKTESKNIESKTNTILNIDLINVTVTAVGIKE